MSSAEETNKDLVRRFFEALAQRDLDALEEMMVPDFVNHTKLLPGQEVPDREGYLGREGYIQGVADDHAAFSNFRYIIEDQAAEGDKVITRSTVSAGPDCTALRHDFAGFRLCCESWPSITLLAGTLAASPGPMRLETRA